MITLADIQRENEEFIADAEICIKILEDLKLHYQNAVMTRPLNRSKIKRTRLIMKDLLMKYEQ